MASGTLYLIPCVISEEQNDSIPKATIDILHSTRHFIVERARTARRFIKTTNPPTAIQDLQIMEMDKRDYGLHIPTLLNWLKEGHDVGILSESGCPGVADPGYEYVCAAHENNFSVSPLVGPSSILLALMASGLNGQNFAFNGYLPIKKPLLNQKLRLMEKLILKEGQSQIFIETPYRNDQLIKEIIRSVNGSIRFCIAADLTGKEEYIACKSIKEWKKTPVSIGKKNCIFLLGK